MELRAVALWKRADSGLDDESYHENDQKTDLTEVLWNVSAFLDENQSGRNGLEESRCTSSQDTCCRLCLNTDFIETFEDIGSFNLYVEQETIPVVDVLLKYFEIEVSFFE